MKKVSAGGHAGRKHQSLFVVESRVPRADAKLVERIAKLPTANLSDAAGNLNSMDSGIHAMWPGARLCGPACTVATRGGDFLATLLGLGAARRGDVLVIDSQGSLDTALWGEITTAEAVTKGLAGLVANGNVRDIEGIQKRRFPVFARGTVPRVAGRGALGEVNVPIQCGGAVVRPGDIVVGDADGVVVIPLEKAEQILRRALEVFAYEEDFLNKVLKGGTQVELLKLKAQFDSLERGRQKRRSKSR